MATYLTLAPCARNEDGTYRDLYWITSNEHAQSEKLWFEINLNYMIGLQYFCTDREEEHFNIEESKWFCEGSEIFGCDSDRIPQALLCSPEVVKQDLLNWKAALERSYKHLPFRYSILLYKAPNYIPNPCGYAIILQDDGFFEYSSSHGHLRCYQLRVKQSIDSPDGYLSRESLIEDVCTEKFIYGYSPETTGQEEICLAETRKAGKDAKDFLSITRETAYEYFLPYADHMITVCDNAIKNNHMLIAGTL